MSQFIGASMPAAYAGDLTRDLFNYTAVTSENDKTSPVTAFGVLVKLNSAGTAVTPVTASSDAVAGISVRKFGSVNSSGQPDETFMTVLKRGYIAVVAPTGETIKQGMQVYMKANGAITSQKNDGGDVPVAYTPLTGAFFNGPAANGIVEVAYNI